MVFQAANLFDAKTAGENIAFPLKVAAKNSPASNAKDAFVNFLR